MPVTASEVRDRNNLTAREALEAEGITPATLAKKLKSELNANETKFFQKDGKVISKRSVIAWGIRQAARIDAQKLLACYPADQVNVNHAGIKDVLDALDGRTTGLPSQREGTDGSGA